MTWFLAYNRTKETVVVDRNGRTVQGRGFTYADDQDATAAQMLDNNVLQRVPITFDPTGTGVGIQYEAFVAAGEVVARNGGTWTPPTPVGSTGLTLAQVDDLIRTGRLTQEALDGRYARISDFDSRAAALYDTGTLFRSAAENRIRTIGDGRWVKSTDLDTAVAALVGGPSQVATAIRAGGVVKGIISSPTQPTYQEGWLWDDGQPDTSTSSGGSAATTAADVSFPPYGQIAAANVAAALRELEDEKVPKTALGAASGVATLGADGKVPASQLPASSGGGSVATSTVFVPRLFLEDGSDDTRMQARYPMTYLGSNDWGSAVGVRCSTPPYAGCTSAIRVTGYILSSAGGTAGWTPSVFVGLGFKSPAANGRTIVFYARPVSYTDEGVTVSTTDRPITMTVRFNGGSRVDGTTTTLNDGWRRTVVTAPDGVDFTEFSVETSWNATKAPGTADSLTYCTEITGIQQGDLVAAESGAASAVTTLATAGQALMQRRRRVALPSPLVSDGVLNVPGVGYFLLPASVVSNTRIDLPELNLSAADSSYEPSVVDLLIEAGSPRGVTLPRNLAIPSVYGTAYEAYKTNFLLNTGEAFHMVAEWTGALTGWVLRDARIIPPSTLAAPAPAGGPLRIPAYHGRSNLNQGVGIQAAVNTVQTRYLDAVRTWLATDGLALNMAQDDWSTMPAPPEIVRFVRRRFAGAGGVYLPPLRQVFALVYDGTGYGLSIPVHEVAHAIDDRWSAKLKADNTPGFVESTDGGWLSSQAAFQTLYQACLADTSLTAIRATAYAYTNVREFFAEVLTGVVSGGTWAKNSGGNHTLAEVVGASRVTPFTDLFRSWGLIS